MRKKPSKPRVGAVLRRWTALFFAGMTVWLLWLTADPGAAAETLGELFSAGKREGMGVVDRLAAAQSALLWANLGSAEGAGGENENGQPPEESARPAPGAPLFPSPAIRADPEVATTTAPDDIVGRTMVPGSSSRYVSGEGVYIYNYTDYSLDVEGMAAEFEGWGLSEEEGPHVLIYHSHTTEAYTMDGTDIYEESDAHRTTDREFNMIRIGAEMKAVFEEYGLEVIHDDALYDYPVYSGAYDRSARGVAELLEEYPTIRLVLDVHRDALTGTDGTVYKTVAASVDRCAQVMLVVGSDAGGQSHKNWRSNLTLAVGLQSALLTEHGTFIRPIVLRSSRFNQQMSPGALLVEVGSHGNTLQEAIAAARTFAGVVAQTIG